MSKKKNVLNYCRSTWCGFIIAFKWNDWVCIEAKEGSSLKGPRAARKTIFIYMLYVYVICICPLIYTSKRKEKKNFLLLVYFPFYVFFCPKLLRNCSCFIFYLCARCIYRYHHRYHCLLEYFLFSIRFQYIRLIRFYFFFFPFFRTKNPKNAIFRCFACTASVKFPRPWTIFIYFSFFLSIHPFSFCCKH